MWIKSLQNYSTLTTTYLHYNMHTFIIPSLILNTHVFIVHQNIIFMVISYNHNLYFKIQCKKFINRITIHSFIILILQRIHTTIWIWKTLQSLYIFCLVKISIKNTTQNFHVLLRWNQTTRLNMWYQKIETVISATKYIHIFLYSKLCVYKWISFSQNSHLWAIPKSLSTWFKTKQKFKI